MPRATFLRMADPRSKLTAQELVYAASALRAEAYRAAHRAADPQFESSRAIFESAARTYGELAGNLDRIAGAISASACAHPSGSRGPT